MKKSLYINQSHKIKHVRFYQQGLVSNSRDPTRQAEAESRNPLRHLPCRYCISRRIMKFCMIWKPLSATTDQSRVRTVAENQAITVHVTSLSWRRKDRYSSAVQSRQVAAQPRTSVLKVNTHAGHWLPSDQLRHGPRRAENSTSWVAAMLPHM